LPTFQQNLCLLIVPQQERKHNVCAMDELSVVEPSLH
jgi:hypothetical protein